MRQWNLLPQHGRPVAEATAEADPIQRHPQLPLAVAIINLGRQALEPLTGAIATEARGPLQPQLLLHNSTASPQA